MIRHVAFALAGLALTACSEPGDPTLSIDWQVQDSGVDLSLRGLSVVDRQTVWIGAPNGVVLRTVDGGHTWQNTRIDAADGADLRSANGFDGQTAVFATVASPARFFFTRDGGQSFELVHEDNAPTAFFDSIAFWDGEAGLAFSDPVDDRFLILKSMNGGEDWRALDTTPAALEGEAGFAASNTSIVLENNGQAWIGTGGGVRARVLITTDGGNTWTAADTPMAAGQPGAGIFSLAAEGGALVAVGGDYTQPDERSGTAAWSGDGGTSWQLADTQPGGYRSAVAVIPGWPGHFIATGTNGTDISRDGGRNWEALSDVGYHAIGFAKQSPNGWAVGSDGRIARLEVRTVSDSR